MKKVESIDRSIRSEKKQLSRLTDLLIKELISEEEFKIKKEELKSSIIKLESSRDKCDVKTIEDLNKTIQVFEFAFNAKQAFESGTCEDKKNIFSGLGYNSTLKD